MIAENRPVQQLDLEGNLIREFESIKKAAKEFGGTKRVYDRIYYALCFYCLGPKNIDKKGNKLLSKKNTAEGFIWKYKKEDV